MRPHKTTYSLLGLVVCLLLILAASSPVQIGYHRWRLDSLNDDVRFSTASPDMDELRAHARRSEYHRQCLINLGYFTELHYEFPDLAGEPERLWAFFARLGRAWPSKRSYNWFPNADNAELIVWDSPDRKPFWDNLVAKKLEVIDTIVAAPIAPVFENAGVPLSEL